MDDFQRFHGKALLFVLGGLLLVLLVCAVAVAAGLWWLVLLLLPGGCFGIRITYNIQCRRRDDRCEKK